MRFLSRLHIDGVEVGYTENQKPIVLQQSFGGNSAGCCIMLGLEHQRSISLEYMRFKTFEDEASIESDLKHKFGFKVVYEKCSDLESLKKVLKHGPVIIEIMKNTMILVDAVEEDYVRIRDPYHGWEVDIDRKFLEQKSHLGYRYYRVTLEKQSDGEPVDPSFDSSFEIIEEVPSSSSSRSLEMVEETEVLPQVPDVHLPIIEPDFQAGTVDPSFDSSLEIVEEVPSSSSSSSNLEMVEETEALPQVPDVHLPITEPDFQTGTVADLMIEYSKAWNVQSEYFKFDENSFDPKRFLQHLTYHTKKFQKKDINYDEHFGYIEKFDLDPKDNPQIYMRADLHGDLKSLLENIRSLQEQSLLDEHFKCKPGVHLVFLGDYCDRGRHGTEILEMLMRLREENPEQVHLIRGNHEDVSSHVNYGYNDFNLFKTLYDKDHTAVNPEAQNAFQSFYQTMSLTTYFSINQAEKREYIQCTHGLFELGMDPSFLLDRSVSGTYVPVLKKRELSERVHLIAGDESSPLYIAAKRVSQLMENFKDLENGITGYNWADITENEESQIMRFGDRTCKLSARDIRYYLDLSSDEHRVAMIFRGHAHKFQHLKHENKVLVTTFPVGMDSIAYKNDWRFFGQSDRAYIIRPAAHTRDWVKRAILRKPGANRTVEITEEHPFESSAI